MKYYSSAAYTPGLLIDKHMQSCIYQLMFIFILFYFYFLPSLSQGFNEHQDFEAEIARLMFFYQTELQITM